MTAQYVNIDNLETSELSLTIQTTHQATTAVLSGYVCGEYHVWTGAAKTYPGDKYDYEIGTKLAASRALMAAAAQMQRQANGRMKCLEDNAAKSRIAREERKALAQASKAPVVTRKRFFRKNKTASTR